MYPIRNETENETGVLICISVHSMSVSRSLSGHANHIEQICLGFVIPCIHLLVVALYLLKICPCDCFKNPSRQSSLLVTVPHATRLPLSESRETINSRKKTRNAVKCCDASINGVICPWIACPWIHINNSFLLHVAYLDDSERDRSILPTKFNWFWHLCSLLQPQFPCQELNKWYGSLCDVNKTKFLNP